MGQPAARRSSCMFFIRNIRAVIISSLAIPASIIATFTLMRVMDFTLNNMTLLGLTLAVGIVIDDAIVVLENIFRYIEEKGCSPFEAAIEGTREVALAGHGDDAVARRDLPAGRVHERLRPAVHQPVRLDDGVLDPGVDARQLHADADAQLAIPEGVGCRDGSQDEGARILPLARRWYTRQVNWALDHPMAIIAISVVTALLTVPRVPDVEPVEEVRLLRLAISIGVRQFQESRAEHRRQREADEHADHDRERNRPSRTG